jgi:hypothetical protein
MFDVTAASNSVIEEGKKKLYEVQVEWLGNFQFCIMTKFAYSSSLPERLSAGLKKLE